MTWITVSAEDKPIVEEIERQTDRAAALIASAYVEERLLLAIQARTNRHEKIEKDLYRGSGPLGTFSAKIDLGLLLGIYEPKIHQMLNTIRNIRNEFAHQPKPRDFNSQRIGDLCDNIAVRVKLDMTEKSAGHRIEIDLEAPQTRREAFLNAVKMLLLWLDMEIKQMPRRVPAAPVMPLLAQFPSGS
jgi:hypothetical protein